MAFQNKFENILVIDCESSGMYKQIYHTHKSPDGLKQYQMVSIGLIVANFATLKPVDKLYVEIKWNGVSEWDAKAEKVHGLSKDYLAQYGVSEEKAVEKIAKLILKYWGPENYITCLGHNVAFDVLFLDDLFRRHGIELNFNSRQIDTNSLGMVCMGTYTSDEFFDIMGMPERKNHDALEDAEFALKSARRIKLMMKSVLDEA